MGDLTAKEAGKILKLSPKRTRELALKGLLPGRLAGPIWLFDPADVAEFAKKKRPVGRPPGSKNKEARPQSQDGKKSKRKRS